MKFFSNKLFRGISNNYYDKLKALDPMINSPIPHKGFPTVFTLSTVPVVMGGVLTALGPHYNLFLSSLPDIALYTCIYSSIHTTFMAGVHLGFGSVLFDPELHNEDARYVRLQLIYPFLAPPLATMFCFTYWAMPYSHLNSLYSVSGLACVYIGVMIGDTFYANQRKTVPVWYKDLKIKVTFLSIFGLSMLVYGIFRFPKQTRPRKIKFPPSTEEIYNKS